MIIFSLLLGLFAGAGLVYFISTKRQRTAWESAIADRRRAERARNDLERRLTDEHAARLTEAHTLRSTQDKQISEYRYLLRRADSALAAARETRDQQAEELQALTGLAKSA